MKALREVADEIGERHLARENEGHGPRAQAEDQQRTSDQFDEASSADERQRLHAGVSRKYREADDLAHAMLDDQQAGDDAQYAQYARRPRRECFCHDSPPSWIEVQLVSCRGLEEKRAAPRIR